MGETGKGPYRVVAATGEIHGPPGSRTVAGDESIYALCAVLNAAHAAARRECAGELRETLGPRSLCPDPVMFEALTDLIAKWRTT